MYNNVIVNAKMSRVCHWRCFYIYIYIYLYLPFQRKKTMRCLFNAYLFIYKDKIMKSTEELEMHTHEKYRLRLASLESTLKK